MRKLFLLAFAVVGCAKNDTAAGDSAAATPAPPPPPAALAAADVRGTWNGTSKREGNDSTLNFTFMNVTDSTGRLVFAGAKDSVATTVKFDGDSMIVTSAAYKDPLAPKNAPPVTFRSIGRLKDGKLVGQASIMPAAKPDTVVAKVNWEATRAP